MINKKENNTNAIILKSKSNFTNFLLNLYSSKNLLSFKVDEKVYEGKYDKRLYPFIHTHFTLLLIKLLHNITLKCPFSKNKIKLTKSIHEFDKLSGLYKIEGGVIPNGFDLCCIVSCLPNESKNNGKYYLQPHSTLKKLCDVFNVLFLKTKVHHLSYSFHSVICKNGLRSSLLLKNKKLHKQVNELNKLKKKRKISNDLCYTIVDVPSMTLHKYLQKNSFEIAEWKSILFQILFTLALLKKEVPGFVHHNLSPKRIYLEKVPKGGQFIYKINGKKYYVPNIGFVVKILPSIYSFSKKMYDNSLVYDEIYQGSMGLHPDNTWFYDLHYFCNTLYHTHNVPKYIQSKLSSWVPKHLIGDSNNYTINKRLRILTLKPKKCKTFKNLLQSKMFAHMKKPSKNNIMFQNVFKI